MPIEIRELSIKVNIREERSSTGAARPVRSSKVDKQAIIDECLEQVSALLKTKKER